MKKLPYFLLLCLLLIISACNQKSTSNQKETIQDSEIDMNNLIAWCIVPFDIKERTPIQRIEMLKDLGFKNYAYDWRAKHLPEMAQEWKLARENDINVSAVWMWIGTDTDQPDHLSEYNEKVLTTIDKTGLKTQIWAGFQDDYFENMDNDAAVEKGIEMVRYLCQRIEKTGGELALYNHGGWFGEPENQIRVIENLPEYKIGLIYNFHYGHGHIDKFTEIVSIMQPYLYTVNLNGMKKDGPMILPLGSGDHEKEMMKTLIDAGYEGPFGIVGLVNDADVKVILQENLRGYSEIIKSF